MLICPLEAQPPLPKGQHHTTKLSFSLKEKTRRGKSKKQSKENFGVGWFQLCWNGQLGWLHLLAGSNFAVQVSILLMKCVRDSL